MAGVALTTAAPAIAAAAAGLGIYKLAKHLRGDSQPGIVPLWVNDDALAIGRPSFPVGDALVEATAVKSVLALSGVALTIEQITQVFEPLEDLEKRIALALLTCARLGLIASSDDGKSFSLHQSS